VTEEIIRMLTLRRRITHRVSPIDPSVAEVADSDSRSARTTDANPGSAKAQGHSTAALSSRARALRRLAGPSERATRSDLSALRVRGAAFMLSAAAILVLGAVGASPAAAASPWWHLTSNARPTSISVGEEGTIVLSGENIGNASTTGKLSLSLTLPTGVSLVESHGVPQVAVFATALEAGGVDFGPDAELGLEACKVSGATISCFPPEGLEFLDPVPYATFEVRAKVKNEGAQADAVYHVEATGGGASVAKRDFPLNSSSATTFGFDGYTLSPEEEGGEVDTRAGSHPYQLSATVTLNQLAETKVGTGQLRVGSPADPKDLEFRLPPGQIGNATALPTCSGSDFNTFHFTDANLCPDDTVVGVAVVTFEERENLGLRTLPVPLFNLEPAPGEPARFGFEIAKGAVTLDTAIRSGIHSGAPEDYGVTVSTSNVTQLVSFLASTVTFWGTPGLPSHDVSRGWNCVAEGFWVDHEAPCSASGSSNPVPLLTLPTNCSVPFATAAYGDSWPNQADPQGLVAEPAFYSLGDPGATPLSIDGCGNLAFQPRISSEPTSDAATSPTGLGFSLDFDDEGLDNPEGLAESQVKEAVVTLPQGFTTNPSVAEGLNACSEAEYEAATDEIGTGCTEESKIGAVEIESPLITQKVQGSLYVARQGENPNHDLLTVYMIARNAEAGILVRQALRVVPDPVTGRLTTEVDDIPQLPFSHLHLEFRSGQRAPLITPPACGTYAITAALYPYSEPNSSVERESAFQITQGPEGLGCPSGGLPPFHPNLEAGMLNNAAGTYSPFVTHITRKDSEQEITRFSIKLPTGLLAKLKGVSECPDAAIAQAKSREVEGGGALEEAHPSCPANSEVGHTTVGTGVGNVLAYAPGKLYLAGPYHGSPISLVSITAAKVGPFDLGTVVVRFALDVNHETAEVSVDGANSDPIPHIVDGIPIHLRDIRASVDRPGFTLNPTSCAKKSTAATVLGSGLNFASSSDDVPVTVSSPFQAADCASLGFKPKLALSLTGKKTHRGALPAFKAVLTYPKGGAYANIAKAQVTLPPSEFLEQGHLKNVCTRKVFETGANPGENCPKNSIYGKARAITPLLEAPLEGPVYLRTGYGTRLPELAAALNGPQISITLAGKIDSVHVKGTEGSRIRNSFEMVPDAPVEKFTLELKGGKKGLLVNSTDVCKGTHKALAAFTGQNGKLDEYEPALKAQCGKGKKSGKGGKKKAGH
jgi:hypothetical protein